MSTSPRHIPIADRVERFRRFYRFANERPLLGFFAGSEYPLARYPASRALPDHRPLAPADFDVAAYLDDCDRLFDLHEACGGDFIWTASAFWGIPWLEALLGCPLIADHATGSIRADTPPGFAGGKDVPDFDPASPWVRKAVEFIERIAERSAGRYPLGTTRMRGIADLLAALHGPQDFVYLLYDRPQEVHAVCERLTDLWIRFARLQLDRIPLFHDGVGSFYYNMWAPKETVWHQEDAAALLSPDLYQRFIQSHDARIASSFAGCIMHQHPTSFVPTDFYLDMPFIALEMHVDEGGPGARDLYETHMKILPRKPLLIWGRLSRPDLEWIFSRLPAPGLAVLAVVDGPEDADRIWSEYMS